MSTTATNVPTGKKSTAAGPSLASYIAIDGICEPGCYVCCWSGHLLRVPEDGIVSGGGPCLTFVGPEPLFVVKIADNPYLTLTKARMLAANFDVNVNF